MSGGEGAVDDGGDLELLVGADVVGLLEPFFPELIVAQRGNRFRELDGLRS